MLNRHSVRCFLAALACALLLSPAAFAGSTITIVNVDQGHEGFNDPTPVAPVGGNPGTTLGSQRLIAFQHAANLWGSKLDSDVNIRVQASFDPLGACDAFSGILGAAGTIQIVSDFPGAALPSTWYPTALANRLAGLDLIPGPPGSLADDIVAFFNSDLDNPVCLGSTGWYYGLDNNHGSNIDLVAVLLHELGHGLGFQTFVDKASGEQPLGLGDIYSEYILDTSTGLTWNQMTDAERAASAINTRNVVWNGPNVTAAAPGVLAAGTPLLTVNSPAAIAGIYQVGTASFGPALVSPGITGDLVQGLDGAGASATDACEPLTNGADVTGKIALVDRGNCTFVIKVKNAQDAGAIAVVIADNVAGSPPPGLGGTDPAIVIPSVRITLADGNTIKAQLALGVNVTLGVDLAVLAGADPTGRVLLWTPNPLQSGSSISHWDQIASPNLLMEPAINSDLTHEVDPPEDLTLPLLLDIGWTTGGGFDDCPVSDTATTVTVAGCETEVPNIMFNNGCTLSDLLGLCAESAASHGDYVSCVASVANGVNQGGGISGAHKGRIQSCVAGAEVP